MRIKFLIGVPDEFKMNYSFKLTNLGYSPFEPNKYNEKAYVFLNKLSEIESLNLDESNLLRDIEILIFNNPSIFNVLMEKNISRDGIIDLNDPKVLNDFDKFISSITRGTLLDDNQVWYANYGKSLRMHIIKNGGNLRIFYLRDKEDFNHYIDYLELLNRVHEFSNEILEIFDVPTNDNPNSNSDRLKNKVFEKIYKYDAEVQDNLQWLKQKEFKYL